MRALQSKSLCLMLVSVFTLIFSLGIFSFRNTIVNKILHSVSRYEKTSFEQEKATDNKGGHSSL